MDLDKRPHRRPVLGISYFILSAFFTAFMAAAVKEIGGNQPTSVIVFWRNLVGLVLIFPWTFFQKEPIKTQLKTSNLKIHLVRTTASFSAVFCYFYSIKYLSLSGATLLFNTMPIFVPLVAFFWKRIVIIKALWWGLSLAFLGIVLALNPGKGIFHPAALIALLSGILGAISLVSLRLGHYSDTTFQMMFYLFLISTVMAALISLIFSYESFPFSLTDFYLMLLVGFFGLLYQFSITQGGKYVPMRLGSIFIYFSVIITFFIDRWIWKTEIPLTTYFGFALIVLGAILKVLLYPKDDIQLKSSNKT